MTMNILINSIYLVAVIATIWIAFVAIRNSIRPDETAKARGAESNTSGCDLVDSHDMLEDKNSGIVMQNSGGLFGLSVFSISANRESNLHERVSLNEDESNTLENNLFGTFS